MIILTKDSAIKKLRELIGQDLRPLADEFGVTVSIKGKPNKGWAGHTLEKYLGLGLSSAQTPNGGSWELKTFPFKYLSDGETLAPKETFAITMINPNQVASTDFFNSHLWQKLNSMIMCGRLFIDKSESSSKLLSVDSIDLNEDQELIEVIKNDYNLVKDTLINCGFNSLTGKMGKYIQPRTKGAGHGSTSRAFYGRTQFIKAVLDI